MNMKTHVQKIIAIFSDINSELRTVIFNSTKCCLGYGCNPVVFTTVEEGKKTCPEEGSNMRKK